MKIRNGFVSNSSSASYVLIGFDATCLVAELGDAWHDFTEELYDNNFMILDGTEGGVGKNQVVIGKELVVHDGYCDYSSQSFTMSKLIAKQQEIAESLLPLVQEYPADVEFKLYIGTRAA